MCVTRRRPLIRRMEEASALASSAASCNKMPKFGEKNNDIDGGLCRHHVDPTSLGDRLFRLCHTMAEFSPRTRTRSEVAEALEES